MSGPHVRTSDLMRSSQPIWLVSSPVPSLPTKCTVALRSASDLAMASLAPTMSESPTSRTLSGCGAGVVAVVWAKAGDAARANTHAAVTAHSGRFNTRAPRRPPLHSCRNHAETVNGGVTDGARCGRLRHTKPTSTPNTKPPTWADHAICEAPRTSKNCCANQKPSSHAALTLRKRTTGPRGIIERILVLGNQTRYAPMTPAMAPDAPTRGTVESG